MHYTDTIHTLKKKTVIVPESAGEVKKKKKKQKQKQKKPEMSLLKETSPKIKI